MLHLFAYICLLIAVLCAVLGIIMPFALVGTVMWGLMWVGCEAIAESLSPTETDD